MPTLPQRQKAEALQWLPSASAVSDRRSLQPDSFLITSAQKSASAREFGSPSITSSETSLDRAIKASAGEGLASTRFTRSDEDGGDQRIASERSEQSNTAPVRERTSTKWVKLRSSMS